MQIKEKRIQALCSVIKKHTWEMEQVKADMMRAKILLQDAEKAYDRILSGITLTEEDIRRNLTNEEGISPDILHTMRAYLLKQYEVLRNSEQEKIQAQRTVEEIGQHLERQQLKIRSMEKLRERRLSAIRIEEEKRTINLLDEMWLQRIEGEK
jgi:flagellar biosynthesis chaperone FliJ